MSRRLNRFPSSKNGGGFKPLSDAVHEDGLKFGIHIIRGIPKQTVMANTRDWARRMYRASNRGGYGRYVPVESG